MPVNWPMSCRARAADDVGVRMTNNRGDRVITRLSPCRFFHCLVRAQDEPGESRQKDKEENFLFTAYPKTGCCSVQRKKGLESPRRWVVMVAIACQEGTVPIMEGAMLSRPSAGWSDPSTYGAAKACVRGGEACFRGQYGLGTQPRRGRPRKHGTLLDNRTVLS